MAETIEFTKKRLSASESSRWIHRLPYPALDVEHVKAQLVCPNPKQKGTAHFYNLEKYLKLLGEPMPAVEFDLAYIKKVSKFEEMKQNTKIKIELRYVPAD